MEFRDGDRKTETPSQSRAGDVTENEPRHRVSENAALDLPALIERGKDIRARSRDLLTRLLDLFRDHPRT